jgi:hypothetical protein
MRHDEDIERVIKSSPEVDERWRQAELDWVTEHRLVALPGSDALTQAILADGVHNQLGHGSFSRVYAIDENWVLKLSRDWTTLKVMEALQSRSSRFPRIQRLMENQAEYDGCVYHAAIVERLEDGFRYGSAQSSTGIGSHFEPTARLPRPCACVTSASRFRTVTSLCRPRTRSRFPKR